MKNSYETKTFHFFAHFFFVLSLAGLAFAFFNRAGVWNSEFNGEIALGYVEKQVSFGPRYPGAEGHALMVDWMAGTLVKKDWKIEVQTGEVMNHAIINLIAKRGEGRPWVILGAHYDTRMFADRDPDPANRSQPVPGANDGASGVAILLELARVIDKDLPGEVWLVFFDAEDNGDIPEWDWILGSRYFVENLEAHPDAVVIVDMVGDAHQNIFIERNSDPNLTWQIWSQAAALGYVDRFIPIPKHSLLDDHTPFLWAGIPAVNIIDFDYPYWHTLEDTSDKVSAKSLQVVGETLMAWLEVYMRSELR